MALSQVFSCPRTLARLRANPLGRLLEEFCDWLLDSGFTRGSIRTHLCNASHLNQYLGCGTDPPRLRLSAQDVKRFFTAYAGYCRNRGPLAEHLRAVRYSINRLIAFLRHQGRFDELRQLPLYQPLLDAYLGWLRKERDATPGTVALRGRSLTRFLRWLGPEATVEGLSRLSAEQVEGFFLAETKGQGQAYRRSMQAALRTFFRFCLQRGWIGWRLDRAVPTLRTYRLSTVPRGLSEAQARGVLESVDRTTPIGQRDYAILQLLYHYGVRAGQVRALRLADIAWSDHQILFRATKNGKDSRLPLTREVGESLLEYLRNARPRSPWPEVFLTCRAPYGPLGRSHAVSEIVRRRLGGAGIVMPHRGAHVFRHGFAARMVAQGHSLKAVADVLGHRHLATTFGYAKVDFPALEAVPLPWPEEDVR